MAVVSYFYLWAAVAIAASELSRDESPPEVRLNNSSLSCWTSINSGPIEAIWQINNRNAYIPAAELKDFSDGDRIRCAIEWSGKRRINSWSAVVIVRLPRNILAIEGVTSVLAHSNELLDLPPTIAILKPSFSYSRITSVAGSIVTFCNATYEENQIGLLAKLPNTIDASTVLYNPAASFYVGNLSLQLNLGNSAFNFSEGQLYIHISIGITGSGGSSDSLSACYKVMEKDVVETETSTLPGTSTKDITPSTVSTLYSSSEDITMPPSSPPSDPFISYILTALVSIGSLFFGCVSGSLVTGSTVWHCSRKKKSKLAIPISSSSPSPGDPEVPSEVLSQPIRHQGDQESIVFPPSQASSVESSEYTEQVRPRHMIWRHPSHAALLRDPSEGVCHQVIVNHVPTTYGHFAQYSTTPNSSVAQQGDQLLPGAVHPSPVVEPSATSTLSGLPSTARLGSESVEPCDEPVMQHAEAAALNETDPSPRQSNYVRSRQDTVYPSGTNIIAIPQHLLPPYDNRSTCVYVMQQSMPIMQQQHRHVVVGDTLV